MSARLAPSSRPLPLLFVAFLSFFVLPWPSPLRVINVIIIICFRNPCVDRVGTERCVWPPGKCRKSERGKCRKSAAARIMPVVHMDLVGTQRFCTFCRAAVLMCSLMCSLLLFCLAFVPRSKQHHARIVRCLHLLATAHFKANPLFHHQHAPQTCRLQRTGCSREGDVSLAAASR